MTIILHIIYALIFIGSVISIPIDDDYNYSLLDIPCERHREYSINKFTHCSKGKCECLPNYQWYYRQCVGNLNETCDSDNDCMNKTEISCIFNKCTNYTDFMTSASPEEKERYRATTIESHCETDNHCKDIYNTVCKSGKCECVDGYLPLYENNCKTRLCRPVTNKTCNVSEDCGDDGTDCFLNICMESEKFFVDFNAHNVSLYVAKNMFGSCRTNDHCRDVENTHCDYGKCRCLPGLGYKNGRCINETGMFCQYHSSCQASEVLDCIANKCVNPEIFFSSPAAETYAAEDTGKQCRDDYHCRNVENSHCNGKYCTCSEGFRYHKLKCGPLGYQSCAENKYNCYFGDECFDGICYTPSDYFKTSNSSQYVAESLGDICRTDNHCRKFKNSSCVEGHCKCNKNYEDRNGTCQEEIIKKCFYNSDCKKPGHYCFLNECLKPEKFFTESNAKNMSLYAAKDVHAPCRSDRHCRKLSNTHCFGDICDCLPDHEYLGDRKKCLKMVDVPCQRDDECLMPRTFCFFNKCLYPEQFLDPSNGYKIEEYATKRLGSEGFCQTHHHCRYLGGAMCYNRQCICQNYYSQEGKICIYNANLTYERPKFRWF